MLDRFLQEPAKDGHFIGFGRDEGKHHKDAVKNKL
jgi:hypothetical protein